MHLSETLNRPYFELFSNNIYNKRKRQSTKADLSRSNCSKNLRVKNLAVKFLNIVKRNCT